MTAPINYVYGPGVPPDPPPRKKRHWVRWTLVSLGAFLLVLLTIGLATGGSAPAGHPAVSHAPAVSNQPPPQSQPPPPASHATTKVHFYVWGTGNAQVMYGSDSENLTPPGSTGGPLGDATPLPWTGVMKFDPSAQYYQLSAQLEGGGEIHVKIVVTRPGYNPLTVSKGHAVGGYNIASAQAAPSNAIGTEWINEG